MRLSKPVAILLLVATLAPIVYFMFFMAVVLLAVVSAPERAFPHEQFVVLFVMHLLCMIWIWGLIAFYVVFLFKSPEILSEQRVLWAVVLFFANIMAMPVFWYLYVWPKSTRIASETVNA